MNRPTMEDVAARAGVSRALVSIVYRDAPGASDATRARVLEAGEALGYRPDHRARLLGRTRTRLLGVTFDVAASFHGALVESLYAAADSTGYDLALSAVAPTRSEPRAIQSLLDYRCEALILLGPQLSPAALADLATSQPVIAVGRKVKATGVDVVRTDDAAGARLAVEHLVELGHRHILHVDGGKAPGATERRTGYRLAMRRAGLLPAFLSGGRTEADGVAAAHAFLKSPGNTTAAVLFNDRLAVGFLDTIRRAGRRVPEDLSLIGYDNIPAAALTHLDLTTIAQSPTALAKLATEHATARLTSATTPTEETVTPYLIPRTTTASPSSSTEAFE